MKLKKLAEQIKERIADKQAMVEKINQEIVELRKEMRKIEWKLVILKEARQKRCKHNGEIEKTYNARSDASFKYWLHCKKCGFRIGHENFDGLIIKGSI